MPATTTSQSRPSLAAVLVAAGRGNRAGGEMPKQYHAIGGVAMIRRSAEALVQAGVEVVQPVIHPHDRALFDAAMAAGPPVRMPVSGGDSRRESVLRGLRALTDIRPDCVLIHDAARPFAASDLIARVVAALKTSDGSIPALPVADTLKRSEDGRRCLDTVSRDGLWRAQTPQGFRFEAILAAHENAAADGRVDWTDDAQIAEAAGIEVAIVAGSEDNFKITSPDDLARAERLVAGATETRNGSGFDVHRFGEGDAVMLCGVAIPHDQALAGHSDADVGWHALTDALLGSIGAGDIGSHFPPSDPTYAGAPSSRFLSRAAELVRARGGRIVNVDITVVCERPRIGPHRDAMIQSTADVLEIDAERVSVKATTTERLGFTGREEGVAAQATATIELPLR